jgi:hypothetical protein
MRYTFGVDLRLRLGRYRGEADHEQAEHDPHFTAFPVLSGYVGVSHVSLRPNKKTPSFRKRPSMRVVLSLLVVGLAAVSADVTEEQPEVDPEGVAHADRDCSNLFCKDTNDGHAHFLPKLNQETGKCECGSYFTEGPCAGMQCAHFRAVRALSS